MVHRLHNRNTGYSNNFTNTPAINQAAIKATEGATALNLNNVVEENTNIQQESKSGETKKPLHDSLLASVSIENATYLQNLENMPDETKTQINDDMPTFEIDSIELATPELFSNNLENNSLNKENKNEKEPQMFEESNLDEDFEIPAFLRRQKN